MVFTYKYDKTVKNLNMVTLLDTVTTPNTVKAELKDKKKQHNPSNKTQRN